MAYACTTCSYRSPKWMGFCPRCRIPEGLTEMGANGAGRSSPTLLREAASGPGHRAVGIDEVDRVLGGGLVPGSVVLLGGEPGVGKSTLLLQIAARVAGWGQALYATAEESAEQLKLRAGRLTEDAGGVMVMVEADLDAVLDEAARLRPDLLIVDSVQTVRVNEADGASGGVSQVRECSARIVRHCKDHGTAAVLIGHITKDGAIAGPKLLEHMVDVVVYLEGESDQGVRVLRSLKNRFGTTNQLGLFEMAGDGLREVADPSAMMLDEWNGTVPGTVAFPSMAGKRPMLVEVQALVSASNLPQPRRSVKGVEAARVHQLLAVLDRHAGLSFAGLDVYVGVAGGVKVREPASDLPVAVALTSSLLGRPTGPTAAWGEVGLTGEVRPASQHARRLEEARRLGISTTLGPAPAGHPQPVSIFLEAAGLLSRQ